MSFQKCPICNGTGIEPLSGTTSNTQAKCLLCNGSRVINTKTGLPPNRVSIENVSIKKSTLVEDGQINVFAERHLKQVIDELDKTGELPYHIRPINALKRTEEQKDEIRHERELDPILRQVDAANSEVIVASTKMDMYSRKGLIFHCQIKNKEHNTWIYRTDTPIESLVLSDDSGVIIPIPTESIRPLISILNDFVSAEETNNLTQDVSHIQGGESQV